MKEYQRYIRLLLEQEEVLKEGKYYQLQFVHLFGSQLSRNYQLMIQKLKAQKSIVYFEELRKKDETLTGLVVEDLVREDLKTYELEWKKLEKMRTHNIQKLPHVISSQLRDVFVRLLQRMHPDLQKERNSNTLHLWHEIEEAYIEDDLTKLLFFEYEVDLLKGELFQPEDMENRIVHVENQIRIIKNNYPYIYKSILENPILIEEKREVLEKEFVELSFEFIMYESQWNKLKKEKVDS